MTYPYAVSLFIGAMDHFPFFHCWIRTGMQETPDQQIVCDSFMESVCRGSRVQGLTVIGATCVVDTSLRSDSIKECHFRV